VVEPVVSVVVPTRDRVASLGRCLASLERAAGSITGRVQVIVADDASRDGTAGMLAGRKGIDVVTREREGGSSAARNSAVRLAEAPLVLFVDDDIEVEPDLISRHLAHHEAHPEAEAALVGLVTWTRSAPITRHMEWLERGGPLFAFDTIDDPENVDPSHFCTANASVKRSPLDRVDGPFDERRRRFTDVDRGLRLAEVGMRLRHDPRAVAWHLRSDSPQTTDDRMRAVGMASVVFDERHPGLVPQAAPATPLRRAKAVTARLLTPLAPLLPAGLAGRIWEARAAWAYAEGRREAGA